jgi:hypothetical protein
MDEWGGVILFEFNDFITYELIRFFIFIFISV